MPIPTGVSRSCSDSRYTICRLGRILPYPLGAALRRFGNEEMSSLDEER